MGADREHRPRPRRSGGPGAQRAPQRLHVTAGGPAHGARTDPNVPTHTSARVARPGGRGHVNRAGRGAAVDAQPSHGGGRGSDPRLDHRRQLRLCSRAWLPHRRVHGDGRKAEGAGRPLHRSTRRGQAFVDRRAGQPPRRVLRAARRRCEHPSKAKTAAT